MLNRCYSRFLLACAVALVGCVDGQINDPTGPLAVTPVRQAGTSTGGTTGEGSQNASPVTSYALPSAPDGGTPSQAPAPSPTTQEPPCPTPTTPPPAPAADAGAPNPPAADAGSAPAPTPPTPAPTPPAPAPAGPSLCATPAEVASKILTPKCGQCHGKASPAAGLDLVTAGVKARILGVAARGCSGKTLADASGKGHFFDKLAGPVAGCGDIMPFGTIPLSAAEIKCLSEWVATP